MDLIASLLLANLPSATHRSISSSSFSGILTCTCANHLVARVNVFHYDLLTPARLQTAPSTRLLNIIVILISIPTRLGLHESGNLLHPGQEISQDCAATALDAVADHAIISIDDVFHNVPGIERVNPRSP